MPNLHVEVVKGSGRLSRLYILRDGVKIGEYERAESHTISRKEREVQRAANYLSGIYDEHGYFQVRWRAPAKTVIVGGTVVGEIPETFWK